MLAALSMVAIVWSLRYFRLQNPLHFGNDPVKEMRIFVFLFLLPLGYFVYWAVAHMVKAVFL